MDRFVATSVELAEQVEEIARGFFGGAAFGKQEDIGVARWCGAAADEENRRA